MDNMSAQFLHRPTRQDLAAKISMLSPGEAELMLEAADCAVERLRDDTIGALKLNLATMVDLLEKAQAMPGKNGPALRDLYDLAFEVKGLAGTFDYPLISAIGESLRCYLQKIDGAEVLEIGIIRHHVQAMSAVLHDDRRGHGGKTGRAIYASLMELTQASAAPGRSRTIRGP